MKLSGLIIFVSMMQLTACSNIFDDAVEEELPFEGKLLLEIAKPFNPEYYPDFPIHNRLIHIGTQQIYGCSIYEIEYLLNVKSNQIFVNISNRFIKPRTSCNDQLGPAMAFIPVNLEPANYFLSLRIGSYTDNYYLLYMEEDYSLIVVDTSFSALYEDNQP